jgi:lipopolysaccharide export system protein LptA
MMKARLHILNSTMLRRTRFLLSALLAMPLCALAAENDRQQPVHLHADRIDIDQKKGLSLYRGHVVFSQGTLRLTAARAEVQNRANALETVTAEGKPVTFRHRPEGQKEYVEGKARRAKYYALAQRLELYGEGTLVTFRHRPEGMVDFIEGEAGRAEYHALAQRVDLYGEVQVQRGRDLFRSAMLHYDIENENIIAEGTAERRVYAALVPNTDRQPVPAGNKP